MEAGITLGSWHHPWKLASPLEAGISLGQDAYALQRQMDCKIGARSEPFAVLTELEWVVSGLMTGKTHDFLIFYPVLIW